MLFLVGTILLLVMRKHGPDKTDQCPKYIKNKEGFVPSIVSHFPMNKKVQDQEHKMR